jgi:hypothetical protein
MNYSIEVCGIYSITRKARFADGSITPSKPWNKGKTYTLGSRTIH